MHVRSGVLLLIPAVAAAFVPTQYRTRAARSFPKYPSFSECKHDVNDVAAVTSTALFSNDDGKKKKKGSLEEGTRSKLLAESIAPWRAVRLFFYAGLGSGAALGGFITLTGVIAALSGARTDLDLNTEYVNLAIDFGAAAVLGVLAKIDLDKGAELDANVEKKIEQKKEQRKISESMKKREEQLSRLNLDIRVSVEGETQTATVGAIQKGGKQHMIIIAGPKKACKDALMGANMLKVDFAMSNVLVVPYEIGADDSEKQMRPSGGFGDRPIWETQPYVASTVGEEWKDYIKAEMDDAVKQSGEKAMEEGIAIVVANNGKVIRRGVGKVPWRQMVEQLEAEVKPKTEEEDIFPSLI